MNMTKINGRKNLLLVAAMAAISGLWLVNPAGAQFAAQGADGHANDANNRVGSGGVNSARSSGGGVNSNDIVNRNVTGLSGFSGPIHERDPRAFTGPIAGRSLDAFNRQSNGVSTDSGAPQNVIGQPQQYYGDTRFTAPPAGSLPLGFNGGYIGTTLNSPASLSSAFNTNPSADSLQSRTLDRETLLINQALRSPEYTEVNNNFNQTGTLNTAPVFGLQTISNGTGNFNPLSMPDYANADVSTIARMQNELRSAANGLNPNPNLPNATQQQQNALDKLAQPAGLNQPLNQPLGQAFDAASNGPISSQITTGQLQPGQLSQTGTIPANASQKSPLLPPPAEQSSLLADLQKRLEGSGEVGKALYDARQAAPATKPPPTLQSAAPAPAAGGAPQAPVPVSTLAMGVKAKGLHDLLAGAEDLIRNGKFDSAVQQYDQGIRVAPNNPLPVLGRAHAELAGGYYARAEMDLRAVFRNDPELLLAQFDLKALLPQERLDYVRKDLHDLAKSDAQAERPWFLLAYLDYNTADAAAADKDLSEAEQRGHGDWSLRLFRQHWALPSNPNPAPLAPRAAATPTTLPSRTVTPKPAPAPARLPASITPEATPPLNK